MVQEPVVTAQTAATSTVVTEVPVSGLDVVKAIRKSGDFR